MEKELYKNQGLFVQPQKNLSNFAAQGQTDKTLKKQVQGQPNSPPGKTLFVNYSLKLNTLPFRDIKNPDEQGTE